MRAERHLGELFDACSIWSFTAAIAFGSLSSALTFCTSGMNSTSPILSKFRSRPQRPRPDLAAM
jgi:hypothetical protein